MLKYLSQKKKKQRGVALIFALGMLGLMVVLSLVFASLSFTEQKAAKNSTERLAARLLAKSAIERAVAVLQSREDAARQNSVSNIKVDHIVSGGTDQGFASGDYDFLWKMLTKRSDIPGANSMYTDLENRLRNGTNSPYWQYVGDYGSGATAPGRMSGRFAYMAYRPVGLLDPVVVKTKSGGSERYGFEPKEIDLTALQDVKLDGLSLTSDNLTKLAGYNEDTGIVNREICDNPENLISRFVGDATVYTLFTNMESKLKDKITSSWFAVPANPIHESFVENGTEYHRFNLNRSDWDTFDAEKLYTSSGTLAPYSVTAEPSLTTQIPWFAKAYEAESDKTSTTATRIKQIAANFVAYFSKIPATDEDLTGRHFWDSITNPTYTANMRTPYINEVVLIFKLAAVAEAEEEYEYGGPEVWVKTLPANMDGSLRKRLTVKLIPTIDVYVELVDLYNSLSEMGTETSPPILTFEFNPVQDNAVLKYELSDQDGTNIVLKKNDVVLPLKKECSSASTSTWPYYTYHFSQEFTSTAEGTREAAIAYLIKTVTFSDGKEQDSDYPEFQDSLKSLSLPNGLTLRLSATPSYDGVKRYIDFAKIIDGNTSVKESGVTTGVFASPMKFKNGTEAAANNNRLIFGIQSHAKDPCANLEASDWGTTLTDRISEYTTFFAKATHDETDSSFYDSIKGNLDKNNGFTPEDATTVDTELTYGGIVSTSFVRGTIKGHTTILSPWEIGFIHRGEPFRTINLKKFKATDPNKMGEYTDGDANLLDYLKFTPSDAEGEKFYNIRGLINLNDISAQDEGTAYTAGNLAAAAALFSNIKTGSTMTDSGMSGGTTIGLNNTATANMAASDAPLANSLVYKISELNKALLDAGEQLNTRAELLTVGSASGTAKEKAFAAQGISAALTSGDTDAAQEELIGKFLMLTTTGTSPLTPGASNEPGNFVVVTALGQTIQQGSDQVPTIDWLKDGMFSTDLTNPSSNAVKQAVCESGYGFLNYSGLWNFTTIPPKTNSVLAPSASDLTSSNRKLHFYPGYDKILATQKAIGWIRKNKNEKWYIERIDYAD